MDTTARLGFEDIRALTGSLGPLSTLGSVDSDGTPHLVPVIPTWVGDVLVFGSHAASRKVRNLADRPAASMQFMTPGETFPDTLLIKGTARVVEADDERLTLWDSGFFPFLSAMYSGPADPMLRFVEFTPEHAFIVRNGGRGPVERWRVAAAA